MSGKIREKSGNFEMDDKWQPCLFLLSLIQEGQLSVTGESMCTKYWLTSYEAQACPGKVWLA